MSLIIFLSKVPKLYINMSTFVPKLSILSGPCRVILCIYADFQWPVATKFSKVIQCSRHVSEKKRLLFRIFIWKNRVSNVLNLTRFSTIWSLEQDPQAILDDFLKKNKFQKGHLLNDV